jgi:hypothetical protein
MLLCGSCILGNHTPISATWLSSLITSWKDIPLISQNFPVRLRIQWVISGWKSRLEGSKKGRISDMVGCYTDATNPRVRGGFYSLAKPANGGNIWREKLAGKYGGKKEREHMAGKKSGNIWREKDGGKKERKKMARKMRGNLCTSFN